MIDLALLPDVTNGRRIYVAAVGEEVMGVLRDKGYDPIDLYSLPRTNEVEEVSYLLAKAQAVEEGTVTFDREDLTALELSMKAHGLLNNRSERKNYNIDLTKETVAALFAWGSDRHTLAANSTVQSAANITRALSGKKRITGSRKKSQV